MPEQSMVDKNISTRGSEQGVYEFPRLTLLGFDTNEPQVKKLTQLGLKVAVCVLCISPYHLGKDWQSNII